MTTPSEPPFSRHGTPVESRDAPAAHQLTGSPRELLYQIAHRRIGEWRAWRRIAEKTGIIDPLDPHGREHTDSPLVVPFERDNDPSKTDDEDLTDELGFELAVHSATGELEGVGILRLTDTAVEEYEVTFQAPDDTAPGVAQTITYADLHDVAGAEATPSVRVASEGARYFVDIELRHDLFFVLWLRRELPIYFDPDVTRYTVLIPSVELPEGRGE